mgnify:CR=1 FL=1
MKTKVYKLVTKPGLTKPLLNEIKVLLKNNYDVVHETKSEIKILIVITAIGIIIWVILILNQ